MMGLPELRQAVAANNKRFHGLDVDWQTEVLVTSGATEALGDCLFGLIEPGDEVVLIEPLYDSYLPIVRRAGGIPKLVRLEPPNWTLPREELAKAFSDKTKLILFNTPMNPCSKVFDRGELQFIADLCLKHDAFCVCDEGLTSTSSSTTRKHLVDHEPSGDAQRTRAPRPRPARASASDRLEGGLRVTAAPDMMKHRQDASVHDLHHAAQPAMGRGDGLAAGRTATTPPGRRTCSAIAIASPRQLGADRFRGCCRLMALTS
jgi:hypothetical protein